MKSNILLTLIMVVTGITFTACNQSGRNKKHVRQENYGAYKGKEIFLFTLTNKEGNILKLTNYGARITWIEVPDKTGEKENITFGYDAFDQMINGDPYFGATVGRYAGRIAKGKFLLDGKDFSLSCNFGGNALHGGPTGWHSVVWNAEVIEKTEYPAVKFTYRSPDMEENYPGNMDVEVIYSWTDKNEIVMAYKCTSDKKTIINITNHAYFNLHGAGNGNILDHELVINASEFIPVDSTLIPTGEIKKVSSSPFDFTTKHIISERIYVNDNQLINGNGYDHTYVLDNREEVDAIVYDPASGRQMEVITDLPGIHFYSGNFLDGSIIGHGGKTYFFRSGLCLESGYYPDSPNHNNFPSTVLNPGETFKSTTIYRFSVK